MTVFSRVTANKSIPIRLGKGRGKSSEQSSEVVNLKVKDREDYLYNRGLDTTAFFPPCEDIARNPFSKPGGGLSPEPDRCWDQSLEL